MKIIAVIPARSGSKSIKNKNIKMLLGKPLIAYSIEQCFKSKIFSNVYVSTDSSEYANISKNLDLLKSFIDQKISRDNSTDYQMINHLIHNVIEDYDLIAHIRPTSPQRNIYDLIKAPKILYNSNFSSLRSVHEMSETAYKAVEIENGKLKPLKKLKLVMEDLNRPRQKFPKNLFTQRCNRYL